MKIDIKNYRLFSPQELRSYAEKGLLSYESSSFVDSDDSLISEAILHMLEGLYTEAEIKHIRSVAFDDGYDQGYAQGLDVPDTLWTTVK